jgi:hypothetical protein
LVAVPFGVDPNLHRARVGANVTANMLSRNTRSSLQVTGS